MHSSPRSAVAALLSLLPPQGSPLPHPRRRLPPSPPPPPSSFPPPSESSAGASPFVLGGYSSGGHVLASLLDSPETLTSRGLPSVPEDLCDGVLYLSPVLATSAAGTAAPDWFSKTTVQLVWGDDADAVPSPLHDLLRKKAHSMVDVLPPHLLVGCCSETFGVPLLDTFFARNAYKTALERAGVSAVDVDVTANHWTVLDCDEVFHKVGNQLNGGWPGRGR